MRVDKETTENYNIIFIRSNMKNETYYDMNDVAFGYSKGKLLTQQLFF